MGWDGLGLARLAWVDGLGSLAQVIVTLTREKRLAPPPGVAVAGEDAGESVEGEAARAIERILEGRSEPTAAGGGGGRGGGRGAGGRGGRGGGRGGGGGDGAVAGGGGGAAAAAADPLMAAAATAAAELGISPSDLAAATAAGRSSRTERADENYGIYSTICKVGKKVRAGNMCACGCVRECVCV